MLQIKFVRQLDFTRAQEHKATENQIQYVDSMVPGKQINCLMIIDTEGILFVVILGIYFISKMQYYQNEMVG